MNLEALRAEIDEIAAQLLQLLNQRARCVIEVGALKRASQAEVYVPDRERLLLERLTSLNEGPLSDEMLTRLFQQIIDTLKELQR